MKDMTSMTKQFYAEIAKSEDQPDGSVKVWGFASTPDIDADGEVVTAEAMKAALPDYLRFGAVREMHGGNAAGTAIEARVLEDGRTWFGAHVVDGEAAKKVKARVYKGFSIGGRVTSRDEGDASRITGLKLIEVSLVDRPANPEAVLTMYKREDVEREEGPGEAEKTAIRKLSALVAGGRLTPSEILAKVEAAETSGDLAPEELAKVNGILRDALAKLGRAEAEAERLARRVAELEAEPAAPRAHLRVVGKAEDLGTALDAGLEAGFEAGGAGIAPVKKSDGSVDEAATLIKKIQAQGRRMG